MWKANKNNRCTISPLNQTPHKYKPTALPLPQHAQIKDTYSNITQSKY